MSAAPLLEPDDVVTAVSMIKMSNRKIAAIVVWTLVASGAVVSQARQSNLLRKDAVEKACAGAVVYEAKEPGVVSPKKTKHDAPVFPDAAGHRFTGTAFVFEVTVDASGTVCKIRKVREPKIQPPLPSFAEAIRESIRQSRYVPGTKDGKPATVRTIVTTLVNLS